MPGNGGGRPFVLRRFDGGTGIAVGLAGRRNCMADDAMTLERIHEIVSLRADKIPWHMVCRSP
ncbi:hypothetical protein ASD53_08300 [Lysobacter sp. Root559]|nr:hypothetical protein ASD53_08300 [Lysobacter sp. Root559]KRA74275.1 hypothetical protein ASD78_12340 [Lysobacter sp. Root667]KRC33761.1 hypothetical protein ASE10_12460 [Lysobacter sp. Root76]KRD69098.1 hypothetical protein ASE45_07910 [Lysobacter sp. Root96]